MGKLKILLIASLAFNIFFGGIVAGHWMKSFVSKDRQHQENILPEELQTKYQQFLKEERGIQRERWREMRAHHQLILKALAVENPDYAQVAQEIEQLNDLLHQQQDGVSKRYQRLIEFVKPLTAKERQLVIEKMQRQHHQSKNLGLSSKKR